MIDLKLLNYLEQFISTERKNRFTEILDKRTNFITVAIQLRSLLTAVVRVHVFIALWFPR